MRFAGDGRPLPSPTPVSQPFFDAARRRELVLQRCPRHGFFHYPRSRCPYCLGDDWTWETASGRGELHAFTIDRVGHDPALADRIPFAIGVVELEEGPRMTANIVGCELDELRVGLPLKAVYEDVDETTLVRFAPR